MAASESSSGPVSPRSISRHQHQWPDNLPAGRCNFRNLETGPQAASCGCARFWPSVRTTVGKNGSSVDNFDTISAKGQHSRGLDCHGGNSINSPTKSSRRNVNGAQCEEWCMCGHHACFHDHASEQLQNVSSNNISPRKDQRCLRINKGQALLDGRLHGQSGFNLDGQPIYFQVLSSRPDGRLKSMAGSQAVTVEKLSDDDNHNHSDDAIGLDVRKQHYSDDVSMPDTGMPTISQILGPHVKLPTSTSISSISTSCLLPVPSQCVYSFDGSDRPIVTTSNQQKDPSQSGEATRGKVGSGLSLKKGEVKHNTHEAKAAASVSLDHAGRYAKDSPAHLRGTSSSNTNSAARERSSPNKAFMNQILQSARQNQQGRAPAAKHFTSPDPNILVPFEEAILSATEAATPSNANTPELNAFDQTLDEAKPIVHSLNKNVASVLEKLSNNDNSRQILPMEVTNNDVTVNASEDEINHPARDTRNVSDLENGFTSLKQAFKDALPHLSRLENQLSEHPSLATSIQNMRERIDLLENASFSHTVQEENLERFDLFDGRLIDVENRIEEQEKLYMGSDAATEIVVSGSSNNIDPHCKMKQKRRLQQQQPRNTNDVASKEEVSFLSNASFQSASSLHSATSSALISAAMHKIEVDSQMATLKQKISDIEAEAPPSFVKPWEIEVIYMPWGNNLKGVWFSRDGWALNNRDPASGLAIANGKAVLDDSADWSQAASALNATERKMSEPFSSSANYNDQSGWSSQEIHNWSAKTDRWCHARACPVNGLVYRRLKSRGLVRKVTLTRPGAREIQAALVDAFGADLIAQLGNQSESNVPVLPILTSGGGCNDQYDFASSAYGKSQFLGLEAPLIPLRKVHKSSKLLFLSRAEMVTPALWTAEFLASSVFMRAAGNKKRLFVTCQAGYLQRGPITSEACSASGCVRDTTSFTNTRMVNSFGHSGNRVDIHNGDNGWSWQRLRELPRVRLSDKGDEQEVDRHVAEADAREECWEHHPILDAETTSSISESASTSFHTCAPGGHAKRTVSTHKVEGTEPVPASRLVTDKGITAAVTDDGDAKKAYRNENDMDYVKQPVASVSSSRIAPITASHPSSVIAQHQSRQIQFSPLVQPPLAHPITPVSEFPPDRMSRNSVGSATPFQLIPNRKHSQGNISSKRAPSTSPVKVKEGDPISHSKPHVHGSDVAIAGTIAVKNLKHLRKRRRMALSSEHTSSVDDAKCAGYDINYDKDDNMLGEPSCCMVPFTDANSATSASIGASMDTGAVSGTSGNIVNSPEQCLTPRRSLSREQLPLQRHHFQQAREKDEGRKQFSPFLSLSHIPSQNVNAAATSDVSRAGNTYPTAEPSTNASSNTCGTIAGSLSYRPTATRLNSAAAAAAAGAYATPHSGIALVAQSCYDTEHDDGDEGEEENDDNDNNNDGEANDSDAEAGRDYYSCQNQKRANAGQSTMDEDVWEGVDDEEMEKSSTSGPSSHGDERMSISDGISDEIQSKRVQEKEERILDDHDEDKKIDDGAGDEDIDDFNFSDDEDADVGIDVDSSSDDENDDD